jgi:hypothetical protein
LENVFVDKEETIMAKWKYDLKMYGQELRKLIKLKRLINDKEDCKEILEHIKVCCNYLLNIMSDADKEEWEYDLEELIELCDDTRDVLEEDDDDYNQDCVNDVLTEFYDTMDYMKVWIAL